jgi:ABC-type Mn2+/Zn2+ transport system permease subunit
VESFFSITLLLIENIREMAAEINFICGKILLVNKKTAPLIMFYLSRENGKGACFN